MPPSHEVQDALFRNIFVEIVMLFDPAGGYAKNKNAVKSTGLVAHGRSYVKFRVYKNMPPYNASGEALRPKDIAQWY